MPRNVQRLNLSRTLPKHQVHAFTCGFTIGAAFLSCDSRLGWLIFLSTIAHEVPSEMADFVALLKGGMSVKQVGLVCDVAVGWSTGWCSREQVLCCVRVSFAVSRSYSVLASCAAVFIPLRRRSFWRAHQVGPFLVMAHVRPTRYYTPHRVTSQCCVLRGDFGSFPGVVVQSARTFSAFPCPFF